MSTLTWEQVSAWRLSQHSLLERAKRGQMLDVVTHMCGVHAQLMSAAELQLWARVADISPDDVQNALWRDKTLVKTWAMRGTLHLLNAADFPLYMAAQNPKGRYRQGSWLKYHGITLDEIEAIIEGTRTSLGGAGITRQQLATTIAEKMGKPHLAELLGRDGVPCSNLPRFKAICVSGQIRDRMLRLSAQRNGLGHGTRLIPIRRCRR